MYRIRLIQVLNENTFSYQENSFIDGEKRKLCQIFIKIINNKFKKRKEKLKFSIYG